MSSVLSSLRCLCVCPFPGRGGSFLHFSQCQVLILQEKLPRASRVLFSMPFAGAHFGLLPTVPPLFLVRPNEASGEPLPSACGRLSMSGLPEGSALTGHLHLAFRFVNISVLFFLLTSRAPASSPRSASLSLEDGWSPSGALSSPDGESDLSFLTHCLFLLLGWE